jgi:rod shape-determining protein MreB
MISFKSVLYVQVRPDRFLVRTITNHKSIERASPAPFSHPRTLVGNFTVADALLKSLIAEAKSGFLKPDIVIHPMERVEGGLSEVEERVFHELALGAGGSRVVVWVGPALTDSEVIEKLKAG